MKKILANHIPTDTYYFGFRSNEVVPIYKIENISSAGIYYHQEKLIFPAEKGGKENTIIWKMEAGESTEKMDKNNDIIYKKSSSQKELFWNGEKATAK